MRGRDLLVVLVFTALLIFALIVYFTRSAQAHNLSEIPRDALKWRSALLRDVRYYWGIDQSPAVFFGQVHQESRWRETARSAFAEGLTQFTPGTAAMIQRGFNSELKALCAEAGGCPLDGRWAIRAMILFDRDLWKRWPSTATDLERRAFMLVGYNGGPGWVDRERRECLRLSGCSPLKWFGNVENACLRADWACRESRHYPEVILFKWSPIYERWLER